MVLSSSPPDAVERAKRANASLRAALQRAKVFRALRRVSTNADAPPGAESTPSHPRKVFPLLQEDAPRIVALEWPFAPLAQRAKEKKARDAQRLRRRAARHAAATTAATNVAASALSAADVMRSSFSQPLGVMAARLLSAATAGAPSLFSEPAAASAHEEETTVPHKQLSPSLPYLSSPSTGLASGAATRPAHTRSPSGSPHACSKPSAFIRADAQGLRRHCHHRHHHRCRHHESSQSPSPLRSAARHGTAEARQRTSLFALSTTSLSPRPESAAVAGANAERRRTPLEYASQPLKTASGNSTPLPSIRAETSPTRIYRPHHTHRHRHHHCSGCRHARSASKPAAMNAAAVEAEVALSSSLSSAGQAPLLRSLFPPQSHSKLSSCACSGSSRSSSSRSRCSGWDGSSWTPSGRDDDSSASTAFSSSSSSDAFFYPMTAPGPDGRYNPRAPLPSLRRCYYGDAAATHFFDDVSSTSTQRTQSRSSTPFSSEWSAGTSTTDVDFTQAAAAPGVFSDTPSTISDDAGLTRRAAKAALHSSSRDASVTKRRASPKGTHQRRSSTLSTNVPTQLSVVMEMDAIEKGQVAPYVSYIFAPEARLMDLQQLEGQLWMRESAPPVSATCVRFCPAGDAYLVGTSSGVLWRVPVGGGQEAVRATPLGSLWPPPHPQSVPKGGSLSATPAPSPGGAAFTEVPSSVVGTASTPTAAARGAQPGMPIALSTPSFQPVPLSGHTAAILSIAFNDDGSLYATTGLDRCVIVWKASTSAKLRRISAVWANTSAPHAPHLVRFMPQNNNYLLVSYVDSGELHLYNSSTGLPVTNVAGTGLTRMTMSSTSTRVGGVMGTAGSKSGSRGGSREGGAITALAVDLIASPFFVSGDADGTVVLWTYRAGDLVTWPTLRATSPSASAGGNSGGAGTGARHSRSRSYVIDSLGYGANNGRDDASSLSGCGTIFPSPLYQLPELRRVAACALPPQAGGVAAISVSTLHAAQLRSLFRPCGSQYHAADPSAEAKGEGAAHATSLHHPLESAAQVFHATAAQNRSCREELETRQAEEEEAAASAGRSRRESHTRGSSAALKHEVSTATAADGSSGSSFPHVLTGLPSRLSDTFSALWGGGSHSGAHTTLPRHSIASFASSRQASTLASPKAPASPAGASTGGSKAAALPERELLKQLCSDAMDVVCPLLILVTVPCDTIYSLGLLLQLSHGTSRHGGNGGGGGSSSGAGVAATPSVSYRLYPLLKTTGPSRMRHVGVGAVPSPDNRRLVVVATPCEEGFVRVLPLLRLETASPAKSSVTETTCVNKQHILATLPMPYGGRCTGIAWSPSGRFLVAITAEGVIYEWSRVYLLNTTASSSNPVVKRAPVRRGAELKKTAAIHSSRSCDGGSGEAGCLSSAAGADAPEAGATFAHPAAEKSTRRHATNADAKEGGAHAAAAAARRRGCGTEYSDTVHQPAATLNFTCLLGTSMMAPANAAAAAVTKESEAARVAFSEEDAWKESFQRELERQRREQAALKLVTQPGSGASDEVSSSGYWLDDDASPQSSRDTFDDDDDEATQPGNGDSTSSQSAGSF